MPISEPESPQLDLGAYLTRVGYAGELRPTLAVLEALHLAHTTHVPFENLDILLGKPIRLDLDSLQAKLVRGGRGGYCYEQNTLFASVLRTIGFAVTPLAARVRYRATRVLPRTHMLLAVEADGRTWVADVGFGSAGLVLPIALDAGAEVRQFAWTYRLIDEPGLWVLQSLRDGAWADLYAFSLEPQMPPDYEVANYYVSTHPESRFTQTLAVQLSTPDVRYMLRNRELITDRGDAVASRVLADDAELLRVLAETFGLRFPPDTRFRYRDISQ